MKLDKMLRHLGFDPNIPYSGINIDFIGDFHQLLPFGDGTEVLNNVVLIGING